jgi:hypothetical protein
MSPFLDHHRARFAILSFLSFSSLSLSVPTFQGLLLGLLLFNICCVLRHLDPDYCLFYLQCTLDYPCADYPVCGLSVHYRKLVMTKDGSGNKRDLATSARTKYSIQQSGSFVRTRVYSAILWDSLGNPEGKHITDYVTQEASTRKRCVYYVCNKQIIVIFFDPCFSIIRSPPPHYYAW